MSSVVLTIDDSKSTRNILESFLKDHVEKVVRAMDGSEGIRLAKMTRPDVILLDKNLPDIDGLKVMAALKDIPSLNDTPVIFLTSEKSDSSISEALEAGAFDYVCKPFSQVELIARIHVALRNRELIKRLKDSALVDPLTQLKNRMTFDDAMHSTIERLMKADIPFAMLMLDIDHFKKLNDTYGHLAGDYALTKAAKTISETCKPRCECFRYGGEEFAVIMHNIDAEHAIKKAETLKEQIANLDLKFDDQLIKITISGGLACFSKDHKKNAASDYVQEADALLYRAKNSGRNQIAHLPVKSD